MKIKVIVDSSIGLNKKEAEKKGFGFIPIIIDFDEKEYESGINIDNEFLVNKLEKRSKVKTAAVKLGELENILNEESKKNDKVLFISLSKHISSINSMAVNISKDLKNVEIYDSEFLTPWLNYISDDIAEFAKKGEYNKIIKLLDVHKGNMIGYLLPANMDALYNGGRITKTQYLLGSLLRISPIVPALNGAMNQGGVVKVKGNTKAIKKAVELLKKDIKKLEKSGEEVKIFVTHLGNDEGLKLLKKTIRESGLEHEIIETILAAEIFVHIGLGAVGVGSVIANK